MADMKDFEPKNCNPTEDWTVVVPRRGKQRRRNLPKIKTIEQQQPWAPTDLENNPEKELDLMQKMQICITKLEKSIFYHSIVNQIQTSEVLDNFHKVLASESEMQMVIYGIGSIESYETPRLQLALAILIKRNFDWVGDIEVFDPVFSTTECAVLKALGCSVLSVNEQGRRQALKPTMFFMPHCEAVLYDNLLQANWGAEFLNRIVLFGNCFSKYESFVSEFKNSVICDSLKHVINVCRYSSEIYATLFDFFLVFIGHASSSSHDSKHIHLHNSLGIMIFIAAHLTAVDNSTTSLASVVDNLAYSQFQQSLDNCTHHKC
ncbi:hypothetical protein GIB67_035066 [Kingdonia uniflora]|uniref:SRR1-like domain-containing protein n=1 Tax=Kingdonia uniflora TaxID=39325 RepID=A0A7J7L1R4_9MAGN|nr:hypothetical protein GIB67_035066 [Kingdonia uniflora]